MKTQTVLNALTSDLAKEFGKTFVVSTAATAGMLTGATLYSKADQKVKTVKNNRAAKKAAKNES